MIFLRRIVGQSMLPSFRPGNIVVAWRFKRPKIGDVVIARWQNREIIKRVSKSTADQVYLLGDNPAESTDSRLYGWLPTAAIVGVIIKGNNRA